LGLRFTGLQTVGFNYATTTPLMVLDLRLRAENFRGFFFLTTKLD
jgi:hypothetical protein